MVIFLLLSLSSFVLQQGSGAVAVAITEILP